MPKQCIQCGKGFEVPDEDLKFLEMVSPVIGGKKFEIPPPTLCPDCRQQRRLSFCNEFNLYPGGKCNLCGKRTLTEHPPPANQPQYCKECWHSDKWDQHERGRDFDFSRPFFEQLYELKRSVPAMAIIIDGENVNCDYIHYAGSSKNCYLIMHADFCENCSYGYGFKRDVSCMDGFYNLHCELCYDCTDVYKCHSLKACQDCVNCNSSAFLRDCIGCSNCFLCVGLRNKSYCFENQQLTREEYEAKVGAIDLGSYGEYMRCWKRLEEGASRYIFKHLHYTNVQNSFGDYLKNCKDAQYCFDCEDVEGAKYCYQMVLGAKNVYDAYQYGTNLQQSYEVCITGADGYQILFTMDGHMSSHDLTYCWYMEHCEHCFGCVNMHHKKYCIFNKQYTKEEYEALVPQIIEHMRKTGEWGEFFDPRYSLFGYNKTTAALWYPLERAEVEERGWKWDDYEPPKPDVALVIAAGDLTDNIDEIGDDILEAAIECEVSGKLFKVTADELRFYRKWRLPLPRRIFFERHLRRMGRRCARKFMDSCCDKCGVALKTTYPAERSFKIYCEKCYLEAVV